MWWSKHCHSGYTTYLRRLRAIAGVRTERLWNAAGLWWRPGAVWLHRLIMCSVWPRDRGPVRLMAFMMSRPWGGHWGDGGILPATTCSLPAGFMATATQIPVGYPPRSRRDSVKTCRTPLAKVDAGFLNSSSPVAALHLLHSSLKALPSQSPATAQISRRDTSNREASYAAPPCGVRLGLARSDTCPSAASPLRQAPSTAGESRPLAIAGTAIVFSGLRPRQRLPLLFRESSMLVHTQASSVGQIPG